VFNAKDEPLGVVGQGGLALLRGVEASGRLSAQWQDGTGTEHACRFSYSLPAKAKSVSDYTEIHATCTDSAVALQPSRKSGT